MGEEHWNMRESSATPTIKRVLDALGIVFGALSVARLLHAGYTTGLTAPFEQILSFYEKSLRQLLGWMEPLLNSALRSVGVLQLQVHPHWKDVLVLMWLYFGVVARVIWPKFKSNRERRLLIGLSAWGAFLAILASVGAGVVPLAGATQNAVMVVFPLFGFALYQWALAAFLASLGDQENWWNRYRAASRLYVGPWVVVTLMASLILVAFADRVPVLRSVPNPGVLLLFALTVLLAIYWLWTGIKGAVAFHRVPGQTSWRTFREGTWKKSFAVMSNTRIGTSILKCILAAVAFLLLGAGLE